MNTMLLWAVLLNQIKRGSNQFLIRLFLKRELICRNVQQFLHWGSFLGNDLPCPFHPVGVVIMLATKERNKEKKSLPKRYTPIKNLLTGHFNQIEKESCTFPKDIK